MLKYLNLVNKEILLKKILLLCHVIISYAKLKFVSFCGRNKLNKRIICQSSHFSLQLMNCTTHKLSKRLLVIYGTQPSTAKLDVS